MKEEKKYPCEQCAFGIYMTVEREWWCDLYDVYAPQVARDSRAIHVYEKCGFKRAETHMFEMKADKAERRTDG